MVRFLCKNWLGMLAIVLIVVLTVVFLPNTFIVAADSIRNTMENEEEQYQEYEPNFETKQTKENTEEEPYILFEDESRRTEFSKHYYLSNNTYVAKTSISPIHYLDEEGKYQNIDNSLFINAEDKFINKANDFNVEFNKYISEDEPLIDIKKGEYEMELYYLPKKENELISEITLASEAIVTPKKESDKDYIGKKLSEIDDKAIIGELNYSNAGKGIDFGFEIEGKTVRQNIIINARQDKYSYSYLIKTDLFLELDDCGNIRAFNESSEAIFDLLKPYMIDSKNDCSLRVEYLLEKFYDSYIITVTADDEWINSPQRIFPVTIEPEVTIANGNEFLSLVSNYYNVNETGEITNEYLYSYKSELSGKAILDRKLIIDNSKGDIVKLNNEQLESVQKNGTTEIILPEKEGELSLTIATNNIALAQSIAQTTELSQTYIDEMGIKEQSGPQSYDGGDYKIYVKPNSLTYTIEMPIYTMDSPITPISVTAYYNPGYEEYIKSIYPDYVSYFGKDVKLNVEQYMIKDDSHYVYIDADGSNHIFYKESNGGCDYYCYELGYYYRSANSSIYTSVENYNNGLKLMEFSNKRLIAIYNEEGQAISIEIKDEKIVELYNYIGNTIYLDYAGSKLSIISVMELMNLEQDHYTTYDKYAAFYYNNESYLTSINLVGKKTTQYIVDNYPPPSPIYYMDYDGQKVAIKYIGSNVKISNRYSSTYQIETRGGDVFRVSSFADPDISNMYLSNQFNIYMDNYIFEGEAYEKTMYYDSRGRLSRTILEGDYNNLARTLDISGEEEESDAITMVETSARFEKYFTEKSGDGSMYEFTPYNGAYEKIKNPAIVIRVNNHGGSACNLTVKYKYDSQETIVGNYTIAQPTEYLVLPVNALPTSVILEHTCVGAINYSHVAVGDIISQNTTVHYKKDINGYKEGDVVTTLVTDSETAIEKYRNGKIIYESNKNNRDEGISNSYTYDSAKGNRVAKKTSAILRMRSSRLMEYLYTYNDLGLVTQVEKKETGISEVDKYEYDSKGYKTKTTTSDGHISTYEYDSEHNLISEITDGKETNYNYDKYGNLIEKITLSGLVTYIRDNIKFLGYIFGDQIYKYNYDSNGNISGITRNDVLIYSKNTLNNFETITYANGQTETNNIGHNRLFSSEYSTGEYYDYIYGVDGLKAVQFDNIKKTYDVNYNRTHFGIETEFSETTSGDIDFKRIVNYNEKGFSIGPTYIIEGEQRNVATLYNSYRENQISDEQDGNFQEAFFYNRNNTIKSETKKLFYNTYSRRKYFYDEENPYFCTQIVDDNIKYDIFYDEAGNILAVYKDDDIYLSYEYDSGGHLIYEGNFKQNMSYFYEYDYNNNLIEERVTDKTDSSTPFVTTNYSYNGDRLMEKKNKTTQSTYTTDEMGNHIQYGDMTLSWTQGNKLHKVFVNESVYLPPPIDNNVKMDNIYTYYYNENGIRYKKSKVLASLSRLEGTVNYYLDGDTILAEDRYGELINYYYDHSGVVGMKYKGVEYYFIKDLFGNIIQVVRDDNTVCAEYEYNAWGESEILTNIDDIANVNPFRYRGYYMDIETGFYYLQSRYYDPGTKRFISADNPELLSTLAQTGELNLYVYCGNNPVMYTDETGESFLMFLAFVAIGAVLGALDGGISAYINGQNFWLGAAAGAIGGVIGGALSSGGFGIGGRGLGSIAYGILNEYFQRGNLKNLDVVGFLADVIMDTTFTSLYGEYYCRITDNFIKYIYTNCLDLIIDVGQINLMNIRISGSKEVSKTNKYYHNLNSIIQKIRTNLSFRRQTQL